MGLMNKAKITVLGSGTCVPRIKRASPGYFIEIDGYKILLDCGSGTLRQLEKAGKDYKSIDLVIITHLHTDHVSDLAPLISAINWTPGFDRKKPVKILGGKGFAKFYKQLNNLFGGMTPRSNTYRVKILESENYSFASFLIETTQGNHSDPSIMIRLKAKDQKIVFTGDTDYDDSVVGFAKNADLLITECSFPENKYKEGHLTPRLVGKIASEAKAKHLLVTHLYPLTDSIDLKKQISQYFGGKVTIAEDLMEIGI